MIEPKVVNIDGKDFILSKFPAVAGRKIMAMYPLSSIPKFGDYKTNEEVMLMLMGYVGVKVGDQTIQLTTQGLIDNHTGSWETLAKVEIAMMEYNCSFFQNGRISSFFDDFAQKLPQWISKMLTDLSALSLQKEKPVLKNSKKRTA